MIYGYARVSTKGQERDGHSLEDQKRILKDRGAEKIFCDSYTGTKMQRPELDKLLSEIQAGDTLITTKLDRIARNASEGSVLIKFLIEKGIIVRVDNMGTIDNTPMGRLILQVILAFAEFERDMIVERTQAGKEIARQQPGYREGRPKKYGKEQERHAMDLLKIHTYAQVENMTGISRSTLLRMARSHGIRREQDSPRQVEL